MNENEQLNLIPAEPPEWYAARVNLDNLPPDLDLEGEPSPELCASVKAWHVLQPVILTCVVGKDTDPPYRVDDGRRRIKAARKAGLKDIEARVYPVGTPRGDVVTVMMNATVSENPLADLAAIERLLAQGATLEDVRNATGMGISTIQKRLRLRALHPELRADVEVGRMKITTATQAAKLSWDAQERLINATASAKRVKGSDVRHATQVAAVDAASLLPERLFENQEPASDWQAQVERAGTALAAVVDPQDAMKCLALLADKLGCVIFSIGKGTGGNERWLMGDFD